MLKRLFVSLVLVAVVLCLCANVLALGGKAIAAQTEVYKLRLQSCHGPAFITYRLLEKKLQEIKIMSGGRLDISLYPANALVPNFQVLEAVSRGTLDATHEFPAYWGGIDPGLAGFCQYPGGMTGEDMLTFLYEFGAIKLIRDKYSELGVYLVGMWGQGYEPINSTIPLRGVSDVKGTKGRIGGYFADVAKELGASTMMIATPEAYTSLQTRVIDWADAGDIVSNWDMGLQEVCPYLILNTGFCQPTSMGTIDINLKKWDQLPEDLKILLDNSVKALAEELRKAEDYQSALVLEKHRERGTEIIVWSEEEASKVRQVIERLETDKWSKQSPLAAEFIRLHRQFASQMAGYKEAVAVFK